MARSQRHITEVRSSSLHRANSCHKRRFSSAAPARFPLASEAALMRTMLDNSHVSLGVIFPNAGMILSERCVQAIMQTIFNAPVPAHGSDKGIDICQLGNSVAGFGCFRFPNGDTGTHYAVGLQSCPFVGSRQTRQIGGQIIYSAPNSAVTVVHFTDDLFVQLPRPFGKTCFEDLRIDSPPHPCEGCS